VADRSLRTIVVVTLALVAPIFALPRVAAAETAIVNGFTPIVGWAVFDFGRTDRLRAKLAQAERRQAAAESRQLAAEARARAAEMSARLERAASESQHAAYERAQTAYEREHAAYEHEHVAYERELATIAAYRKQSDVQRDRLARLNLRNAQPARLVALSAPKPASCTIVAAVPMSPKHPAPAFHRPSPALHHPSHAVHHPAPVAHRPAPAVHHPAKTVVAAPSSSAKDARPAGATRNRSVGWGAI
jgi:hypothetical protein